MDSTEALFSLEGDPEAVRPALVRICEGLGHLGPLGLEARVEGSGIRLTGPEYLVDAALELLTRLMLQHGVAPAGSSGTAEA